MFDKNKTSGGTNGGSANAHDGDKNNKDPLLGNGAGNARYDQPRPTPAEGPSILAGRVVDYFDRPVGTAHIKLVRVDDKDGGKDVSVNPDGYFIIPGVKPGEQYKLTARAKNGEQMLAQVQYATAPNSRLVFQLSSDLANEDTPPVPGPPTIQKPAKTTSTGPDADRAPSVGNIAVPFSDAGQPSGPTPFPPRGQTVQDDVQDLPVSIQVPVSNTPPNSSPPVASVPEKPSPLIGLNPLSRPGGTSPPWPPDMNIPVPTNKASDQLKQPPLPPAPPAPFPPSGGDEPPPPSNLKNLSRTDDPPTDAVKLTVPGSVLLPSCQIRGDHLVNFALREINGTPWEFRQHTGKGKLVLLDFWGTWCRPCREAIPKLRALRFRYGNKGLEIVGIACEQGGSPQAQAQHVNKVCQDLFVNYRQLLSEGPNCPVRKGFDVKSFPTLVLLDNDGKFLWHSSRDGLGQSSLDELERVIQHHLNLQP